MNLSIDSIKFEIYLSFFYLAMIRDFRAKMLISSTSLFHICEEPRGRPESL